MQAASPSPAHMQHDAQPDCQSLTLCTPALVGACRWCTEEGMAVLALTRVAPRLYFTPSPCSSRRVHSHPRHHQVLSACCRPARTWLQLVEALRAALLRCAAAPTHRSSSSRPEMAVGRWGDGGGRHRGGGGHRLQQQQLFVQPASSAHHQPTTSPGRSRGKAGAPSNSSAAWGGN